MKDSKRIRAISFDAFFQPRNQAQGAKVLKVILKNPKNSKWEVLRPPAHIEPAYFNFPEDQVLESPRVYDPYTSPYQGRKAVIINTQMEIPRATFAEAQMVARAANAVMKQDMRGMSEPQKHMAIFHPISVIGVEPPCLDVIVGRTLWCSLEKSARFSIDVIRHYKRVLAEQGRLWRLALNAGFENGLQLTIYHDALLIGEKFILESDEPEAIAAWQVDAKDCWS